MSQEQPAQSPEVKARVLDLKQNDDGGVSFTLDKTTTFADVIATLTYAQPDVAKRERYLDKLLKHAVDTKGVLNNRRVLIDDPVTEITPQAKVERSLVFGEETTMHDVQIAFNTIYGEDEAPRITRRLLTTLVDSSRILDGEIITIDLHNEIATATPDALALEMQQLTDQFYGEDNTPPPTS